MIISKIYETKDNSLTAVVLEDGVYTNFIYDPELLFLEEGELLEETKLGFPSALSYEEEISEGDSLEHMAEVQEEESTLVAEVGEDMVIYPQRMSSDIQELFENELGKENWNKILQQVNGDNGVKFNL